jgi:hypothetical protein
MQAKFKVGDLLRLHNAYLAQCGFNSHQIRHLDALSKCRTAALGGHIDSCTGCGHVKISYNSCRNRHCPTCQGKNKEDWIAARSSELLPVAYFHVVFTLPSELHTLCMHQPSVAYSALFEASWQTIQQFGKNGGLHMGMVTVLHTWGQQLMLHPHLHCIVPGAGVAANGSLQTLKGKGKYLFHVPSMCKVFRAKYVSILRQKNIGSQALYDRLFAKQWVVYAKKPFASPHSVIEYLGRYTHKVAISNHRITDVDDGNISFSYKDYKQKGTKKTMTLQQREFIRRFALHILPHRFVRIRHYGILSSTWKRGKLQPYIVKQLAAPKEVKNLHLICPVCKTASMVTIELIPKRGPPTTGYLQAEQKMIVA